MVFVRRGSISPSSSGMPPKEEPMEKKKEPAFVFHCLGREMVEMDVTCAFESEILYGFLSRIEFLRSLDGYSHPGYARDDRNIGFPKKIESPKHIVLMVNEYCVRHYNIMKTHEQDTVALFLEKLKEFDAKFVTEKPLSILVLLLNEVIPILNWET